MKLQKYCKKSTFTKGKFYELRTLLTDRNKGRRSLRKKNYTKQIAALKNEMKNKLRDIEEIVQTAKHGSTKQENYKINASFVFPKQLIAN